jgi:hypothetical protein
MEEVGYLKEQVSTNYYANVWTLLGMVTNASIS